MCRVRKAASTWEASLLMGLRVSAGKNLLTNMSLDTRRSKWRSPREIDGGCRGRRAATTDQGAVVVNGTRAVGGGGGGSGETRRCGRSLVLWRSKGCGVAPLRCSGGGESHGGSRSRGARRGAGGKWLSGACPDVEGKRLTVAFSRHHLRGGRAPLGLEVAEAAPEVGVFAVEGGRTRLQRLRDEGMFFLGHREGAGVRCRTC